MRIIKDNEEVLLQETVDIMIECWREGKKKKDALVSKFVHRLFAKEKLAFLIMRFKN